MNRDALYLRDILKAADRILEYTEGGREAFFASHLIQDGVIRNFEIIGEAAKQVSENTRLAFPDVPWRVIGRFRDLLIHHYFGVDLDEVWNIVAGDLVALRQRVLEILNTQSGMTGEGESE